MPCHCRCGASVRRSRVRCLARLDGCHKFCFTRNQDGVGTAAIIPCGHFERFLHVCVSSSCIDTHIGTCASPLHALTLASAWCISNTFQFRCVRDCRCKIFFSLLRRDEHVFLRGVVLQGRRCRRERVWIPVELWEGRTRRSLTGAHGAQHAYVPSEPPPASIMSRDTI